MSKKKLVDQIQDQFASRAECERAVTAVFAGIEQITARGEIVAMDNFGTFAKKLRAGRTSRLPGTGETISIPASNKLVFTSRLNFDKRV